jgi:drug/metabolite transporter (DMT)-like permease
VAVAYAGTVVLFVVANKLTTAANAILLQYTAPVYVALFSPWFLGERAQRNDWLSLAVIMVGMLLFFRRCAEPGAVILAMAWRWSADSVLPG